MAKGERGIDIAIDRGGTFTDVYARIPGKGDVILKLLSEDPDNYPDSSAEGIRRVLEIATGKPVPAGQPLDASSIESVRMGTTVATNALLQRKGEKFAFLVTKGFKDLLVIGTQARPELFNLNIQKPDVLYDHVIEVDERITPETWTDDPDPPSSIDTTSDPSLHQTSSGTPVRVLTPLDEAAVEADLRALHAAGIRSLAVCLMHAYLYPAHEQRIATIAHDIGFSFVSLSSVVSPTSGRMLARGNSACVDAYLTPHVARSVDAFVKSFNPPPGRCDFMRSDGALTSHRTFSGLNAILSGPAGGVVGYARTSYAATSLKKTPVPVIGFDMGGTSTDVSRYGGALEIAYEHTTAGIDLHVPQLAINTVAAGGGSILRWRDGLFHVGPESAGAMPGPACYRRGGPLTVTDANLLLGRLVPEFFPRIFGENRDQGLDEEVVRKKFDEVAKEIGGGYGVEDVALGFLRVANETMARSIRAITEARGYATSAHHLACFGGAAGQHACALARSLGIPRVLIHRYSSVLSAYGMALADVAAEARAVAEGAWSPARKAELGAVVRELKGKVRTELEAQGLRDVRYEAALGMRYAGTDISMFVELSAGGEGDDDAAAAFEREHQREYSFVLPGRTILVDAVRVRGVAQTRNVPGLDIDEELKNLAESDPGQPARTQKVWFEDLGELETPVYLLADLKQGARIRGPSLVIDETQTLLVEPGWKAVVTSVHVVIERLEEKIKEAALGGKEITLDPVLLSVFGHRFMSIAEQMGHTLQRTSVSVSIKERLDFSCAIFGPDGGLVANAPHIPVHLGSMQYAIQYQHERWARTLKPGDVLLSNHPEAGGTHLPDLTVITPVFDDGKIVFYVASRGHHQDIGGVGITAMMPNSKELWQEGVAIKSFKLVSGGRFDEEGVTKLFMEPGKYPGSSATRRLNDNLSDLRAQVSANQRGIHLVEQLIAEFGQSTVQFYMLAIRQNAEHAIRAFLRRTAERFSNAPLKAHDFFDDGTRVELSVTISPTTGSATFDFTGTGAEVYGCMNTPAAITYSCVIYALRCMLAAPIPLNQGCLTPCTIILPDNSILNPSAAVAICGSTIAAQRVTDVILRAFDVCAASQGCANSLGFGNGGKDEVTGEVLRGFTYGEALGGGSGAGPGWHGAAAVNVHATNTRTTDVEVIEKRCPVIVREYSVRKGSGGEGKWKGGDGAVRHVEARIPLRFSILSERRVFRPYGLHGGEDGKSGENWWIRKTEEGKIWTRLGAKEIVWVKPGDSIMICTPGGGGYGKSDH